MMDSLATAALTWADWMWRGLIDGSWVCLLCLALWLPFRKRAPAQLGYGLFLLVLLKLAFPFQLAIPSWCTAWLPAAWLPTTTLPSAAHLLVEDSPSVVGSALAKVEPSALIETIVFLAWASIASVLLIRVLWIQVRTAELARRSRPIEAGELPVDFDALQSLAGVRSPVRFLACDRVHSPAAGGLFRPYVLLPMELCRAMPREPLNWVLLHELAHLRRGDLWVSLLQRIVQVLFFFHPAVWIANWIVDEQREFACDAFALRVSKAPRRDCGEGFLSIVEWSQQHPQDAVATLGMFDSKSVIRRRLMRILNGKGAERSFGARLCTTFVVLMGLLVLPTPKLEAAAPQDPQRVKEIRAQLRELEAIKRDLQKELRKSEARGRTESRRAPKDSREPGRAAGSTSKRRYPQRRSDWIDTVSDPAELLRRSTSTTTRAGSVRRGRVGGRGEGVSGTPDAPRRTRSTTTATGSGRRGGVVGTGSSRTAPRSGWLSRSRSVESRGGVVAPPASPFTQTPRTDSSRPSRMPPGRRTTTQSGGGRATRVESSSTANPRSRDRRRERSRSRSRRGSRGSVESRSSSESRVTPNRTRRGLPGGSVDRAPKAVDPVKPSSRRVRDPREAREIIERIKVIESREPREPREPLEPREPREPREPSEPIVTFLGDVSIQTELGWVDSIQAELVIVPIKLDVNRPVTLELAPVASKGRLVLDTLVIPEEVEVVVPEVAVEVLPELPVPPKPALRSAAKSKRLRLH